MDEHHAHERAESICRRAIELSEDERRAYLDEACAGDSELRATVDRALSADAYPTASMMPVADSTPGPAVTTPEDPGPGLDVAQGLVGDRYTIGGAAGAGGMGRVFAATDTVLERPVAIKIMHTGGRTSSVDPADTVDRQRILTEARAMAGLDHPNLCRIHEAVLDRPRPFIVMEWIDGITLDQSWRGQSVDHRIAVFVKIVEAVAAAHAAGLVHGDLKPANILVNRNGDPVIVDFGLARGRRGSDDTAVGGTPGYAAPEQFEPDVEVSYSADVFSLGAILYELLTDRLAFGGRTAAARIDAVRAGTLDLPETHAPDIPGPLQRICLQSLENDADQRYVDAAALRRDLLRHLRGETVAAAPSRLMTQFSEQVETQLRDSMSWRRRGLITEAEFTRLSRALTGLLRPESHWILDSRRLFGSQVALYLGGWLVLVGLGIGIHRTWEVLESWRGVRVGVPWLVVGSLFIASVWITRDGRQRITLGYQTTLTLAVPIVLWVTIRDAGWLTGPSGPGGLEGMGLHEWQAVFLEREPGWFIDGLLNRQTLLIAGIWLAVCLAFRARGRSSAFTPLAVTALVATAVAAWASAGWLDVEPRAWGWFGVFLTGLGAVMLAPGLALNTREETRARRMGHVRVRMHDAWSVLAVSVLLIVGGLTMLAWNAGDLYSLGRLGPHDDLTVRGTSFAINGVAMLALAVGLDRRRTVVRTRLADALRWISPGQILGGLVAIEFDAGPEPVAWLPWLALILAGCIGLCFLSVARQWRPFLYTGLFYIAVVYARAFTRVIETADEGTARRLTITLLLVAVIGGIATMFAAWMVPERLAARRLARWTRP